MGFLGCVWCGLETAPVHQPAAVGRADDEDVAEGGAVAVFAVDFDVNELGLFVFHAGFVDAEVVNAAVFGEDAGDVAVVDHFLEGVALVCRDDQLGDGDGTLLVAHGFKEAAGGVQRAVSGVGEREGQGGDEGEEVFFHGFWVVVGDLHTG